MFTSWKICLTTGFSPLWGGHPLGNSESFTAQEFTYYIYLQEQIKKFVINIETFSSNTTSILRRNIFIILNDPFSGFQLPEQREDFGSSVTKLNVIDFTMVKT